MNFDEIAQDLSFGYYRPHLLEGSFESGWNLVSQRGAIHKALFAAFEAGQKSPQQVVKAELPRCGVFESCNDCTGPVAGCDRV